MSDLFIRRGADGAPIDSKHLMSPAEILANKRILRVTSQLSFDFESDGGERGLVDALGEMMLCLDSDSNDPIKLLISSPGGNLMGAFALYDVIKSVDSPVWTFGHCCMSGAAILLAAGEKGHRYLYPNSTIMLHLPQVMPASMPMDTKTNQIITQESLRQRDRAVSLLIECGVNKTQEKVLEDIDRVLIMNAEEAVAYGLADKVIRGGLLLD